MFTQEVSESLGGPTAFTLLAAIAVEGYVALAPLPQDAKVVMLSGITLVFLAVVFVLRRFRVVRIQVDERELRVGYGWLLERLPLAEIEHCEPYRYHPLDWGGYGFRLGPQGRMYSVLGDQGLAVRVVLKDGRKVHFSATDPLAVCRAIGEARFALCGEG